MSYHAKPNRKRGFRVVTAEEDYFIVSDNEEEMDEVFSVSDENQDGTSTAGDDDDEDLKTVDEYCPDEPSSDNDYQDEPDPSAYESISSIGSEEWGGLTTRGIARQESPPMPQLHREEPAALLPVSDQETAMPRLDREDPSAPRPIYSPRYDAPKWGALGDDDESPPRRSGFESNSSDSDICIAPDGRMYQGSPPPILEQFVAPHDPARYLSFRRDRRALDAARRAAGMKPSVWKVVHQLPSADFPQFPLGRRTYYKAEEN